MSNQVFIKTQTDQKPPSRRGGGPLVRQQVAAVGWQVEESRGHGISEASGRREERAGEKTGGKEGRSREGCAASLPRRGSWKGQPGGPGGADGRGRRESECPRTQGQRGGSPTRPRSLSRASGNIGARASGGARSVCVKDGSSVPVMLAKSVIKALGRAPREGNGSPLQYSCLENPLDRGAWRATVCGVTDGWDTTGRVSQAEC